MFLDTSGLLCLLHRREPQHALAVDFYRQATNSLTHSYVLAEFMALATVRGVPRRESIDYVWALERDPDVRTVYVNRELHREAMALLASRLDKTYSLCDAVSFVVMRHAGIGKALSTDVHFEQEGFVRLLSPSAV